MKLATLPSSLPQRPAKALLFFVCLSLTAIQSDVRAAVTLAGSSTFNVSTSDYTYSYSITNTGADDLVIVTLPVFSPLGVTGIVIPTGFLLNYDSSQRVVNFIEDGSIVTPQTFAPGSTVGTFSFNSVMGPGSATFVAYDALGTEYTGIAIAPVPEPSGALLGLLAGGGLLARRRRS